jgi:hypothetical protein
MKFRPLLAIALLFATEFSGSAKSLSEDKQRSRLQILHSRELKNIQLTLVERAYLDAFMMLESSNQCGRFFGGSGSRFVLDELVLQLQERTMADSRIGIRMSGPFSTRVAPQDGIYYRLFKQAQLNTLGAFYRAKTFPSELRVPKIGSFAPNTRQARVMMLLHELAHMIQGPGGNWLIPDDGDNPQLSRLNTWTIEAQCGPQIRAL